MSGGSFDYKCHSVKEFAMELSVKLKEPGHEISKEMKKKLKKFVKSLDKYADACYAIEWFFSGDYGEEEVEEALKILRKRQTF